MTTVHEIPGAEALRFLRSLPRVPTHRHPSWVVPAGRGLRLSQRETPGGVRVGGLERLRVLEDLAQHARALRIHCEPQGPTSTWELVLDDARFHLVLSPEVWRGFSGEGQALESLSAENWRGVLPRVRAALQWQSVLDAAHLARDVELEPEVVRAALAALGARGLVGYDLSTSAYFHRELPFDLERVDSLQPRLRAARRLIEQGKVRVGSREGQMVEVFVTGTDVEHCVRLGPSDASCTCPWHAKHRGTRGPCKHILAARLVSDENRPRNP
jgi:SWIM zinc finger